MVLAEIGKKAFSFALYLSIIITVFSLILLSTGISIPSPLSLLVMPMGSIYTYSEQLIHFAQTMNTGNWLGKLQQATTYAFGVLTAVTGVVVNFGVLVVTIFISLAYVMYVYLPAPIHYLALPLFFVLSFIQACIWVYVIQKIASALSHISIIPI